MTGEACKAVRAGSQNNGLPVQDIAAGSDGRGRSVTPKGERKPRPYGRRGLLARVVCRFVRRRFPLRAPCRTVTAPVSFFAILTHHGCVSAAISHMKYRDAPERARAYAAMGEMTGSFEID
jgi:hypothetical protein